MGSKDRRVSLRCALPEDAQTVGRIHVESWNVAYRGIMPDDVIASTDLAYRTKFWGERIADPEWPVFLMAVLRKTRLSSRRRHASVSSDTGARGALPH